jgi:sugar phosphate isomerase/epimerase
MIPEVEQSNINLALETDLNPKQFAELLSHLDSLRVTVNYDIGNSAALGYDPVEELSAYGKRISDIHIKDRMLGGGSVKLGTGNADIPGFFRLLESFDYQGLLIMQAYRDEEGVSIFQEQHAFLQSYMGVRT